MAKIYETSNFIVEAFEKPHVTRTDGGHIKIYPKIEILDRTEMPPEMAIEFIRLTMIVGKAMQKAMTSRGVEITRINYQEMGNWALKKGKRPYFHMHIYGRAKHAKFQPCQEAVRLPDRSTGFYDKFEPLNAGDIEEVKRQIGLISQEGMFKNSNWRLPE
jgi:diadenosine tetraphosphate (Ap4A) HIT family hydrolase